MKTTSVRTNLGLIVAIIISIFTVPLGFMAAGWYTEKILNKQRAYSAILLTRLWSPAVVICCLLIITLIRII